MFNANFCVPYSYTVNFYLHVRSEALRLLVVLEAALGMLQSVCDPA